MLSYRPLGEHDIDQYVALERYAFNVELDRAGPDAVRVARLRGLFVDARLATQLELLPIRVQAGAGELVAMGIGGVASAPAFRRRGYVASLLRHVADELREQGVALALLYPFKPSFYRRYGWASFFERRVYSGPPARFAPFRAAPGVWLQAGPDQADEFDRIYRGALRGRFGPLVRDTAWWRDRILHDDRRRPCYAYIWRDEHGQGRSYLVYQLEASDNGLQLTIRDLVALDPTARAQLFHFIAGHRDQVQQVRFRAPTDAPVNLLFPEPLACSVQPDMMLRLLDVPAALAQYPFPPTVAGRLTLAVSDDWIAANQGVFALEWAAGHCQVTRLPDAASADLGCDVAVLAQLYSRYLRPRTAAAFGVLAAHSRAALELMERAFVGLAPFCSDRF